VDPIVETSIVWLIIIELANQLCNIIDEEFDRSNPNHIDYLPKHLIQEK